MLRLFGSRYAVVFYLAVKMLQLQPTSSETAEGSTSTRQLRRAYLAPDVLRAHKLVAGDWARLRPVDGSEVGEVVVQLWPRSGLEDDVIVLHQQQLQNSSTEAVEIVSFRTTESKGIAKEITVIPVSAHPSLPPTPLPSAVREAEWTTAAVKEALMSGKYLRQGMRIIVGDEDGTVAPAYYQISDVVVSDKKRGPADQLADGVENMSMNGAAMASWYEMDWRTAIKLGDGARSDAKAGNADSNGAQTSARTATAASSLPSYINLFSPSQTGGYAQLGGLDAQITQIRSLLELPMSRPELFTFFGLTPPRGILLHGPPGTGKTALARAVASSSSCSCIVVNGPELASAFHGESEERLRGVFDEAKKRAPCIVMLDEVDALCPRRDGDGGEVEKRVVATLLTLMDGMSGGEGVFVIAATNRPNSIDPALRRPGRFDREIEIGIPDAHGREGILKVLLSKMPHTLSSADIASLASRTHGFVGADLSSLVREGAVTCIERWVAHPFSSQQPRLELADIEAVLPTIRPSTMREVFVETTQVRWSDIGGQDSVKQKLRECVEWPLTHKDTFKRLGVQAPKGVLLYGPPGCSKTMTAKALATESGINFLAVKGPELLNKYVGESERAVREIFRKARAAAPSIIFFDEIDALGSARSEDTSHSGVLTSLLNEMDGIEELAGVTVVAATNRPDVLDDALMRPGRLDRILFVGAPDVQTRKDIFKICLGRMAVEEGVDVDELAKITEGCSGAEVASICQDAALSAMNEDIDTPFVKKAHLLESARSVRRRITPEMIRFFDEWRDQSGVRSA